MILQIEMKKLDHAKSLAHLDRAMFYMGFGERLPTYPLTFCYVDYPVRRFTEHMQKRLELGSLEEGKTFLCKNHKHLLPILVNGDISAKHFKEAIEKSNLILVTRDVSVKSDGKLAWGSIRGFALCVVSACKLTLELVGNLAPPKITTRAPKVQSRGSDIMNVVKELGENRPDGIELWAVPWVISYYWNLGFRFKHDKTQEHYRHVQELDNLLKNGAAWTYEALKSPLKHLEPYVKDKKKSEEDQFDDGYRMIFNKKKEKH